MTDVTEKLFEMLEEAVELRFGAAHDPEGKLVLPPYETGPGPFVQVLVRARARADRIEELWLKAKQVRGVLGVQERELQIPP